MLFFIQPLLYLLPQEKKICTVTTVLAGKQAPGYVIPLFHCERVRQLSRNIKIILNLWKEIKVRTLQQHASCAWGNKSLLLCDK